MSRTQAIAETKGLRPPGIGEKHISDTKRLEHDLLGDREVLAHVYYGVHILRAMENFDISGTPISIDPDLVNALASVKEAAAFANHDLGLLNAN